MGVFIEEIVGLIVWLVANVVYLTSVRTGTRGFTRFLAFWMGFPATWVTLLVVKEGSQPKLQPPPDDEAALLEAVRRDRALRAEKGAAGDVGPGPDHDDDNTEERT